MIYILCFIFMAIGAIIGVKFGVSYAVDLFIKVCEDVFQLNKDKKQH